MKSATRPCGAQNLRDESYRSEYQFFHIQTYSNMIEYSKIYENPENPKNPNPENPKNPKNPKNPGPPRDQFFIGKYKKI